MRCVSEAACGEFSALAVDQAIRRPDGVLLLCSPGQGRFELARVGTIYDANKEGAEGAWTDAAIWLLMTLAFDPKL
jgi:hypothetical protein